MAGGRRSEMTGTQMGAQERVAAGQGAPWMDLFRMLGLFTMTDFLDAEERAAVISDIRSAAESMATVFRPTEGDAVDEGRRSTKVVEVSDGARLAVEGRLPSSDRASRSTSEFRSQGSRNPSSSRTTLETSSESMRT
jgi:hypothetical protein